jgi:hypothetical protein
VVLVVLGLFVISKNSLIEALSPGVLVMVQPRKSRLLPLKGVGEESGLGRRGAPSGLGETRAIGLLD